MGRVRNETQPLDAGDLERGPQSEEEGAVPLRDRGLIVECEMPLRVLGPHPPSVAAGFPEGEGRVIEL